jgi:hypothetical protein
MAETCNGIDDDCDGVVDNGNPGGGASCSAGKGACLATGTMQCTSGSVKCNAIAGTPNTELCNGIDDDCDGVIDNGFPNKGSSCTVGTGMCQGSGTYVCSTSGTATVCNATPANPAASCTNTDLLASCSNGTPVSTSCAAMGLTCYNNKCQGACAAGTYQCTSRTESQKCDGTGAWNNNATCSPSASTTPTICDTNAGATYGTCIANPPYDLGNDNGAGRVAYSAFANLLLAQPVITNANVQVLGFGLVTTSASVGGTAYIGLYADSINSSTGQHEPGAFINRTAQIFLAASSSNQTKPAFTSASNINLTANTQYWIVTNLYQSSSENIVIYTSSTSDAAGAARSGTRTFEALSTLASGATMQVTGDIALFMQVQKY